MNIHYQKQRLRRLISISIYKLYAKNLYNIKFDKIAPVDKVIEIKTSDIVAWYRGNRYDEFTFEGEIIGGDWSKKLTPREQILKNSIKYRSVIQRYRDGIDWSETDLFRIRYQDQIDIKGEARGYKKIEDLKKYYIDEYDKLFHDIKTYGVVAHKKNSSMFSPMYIYIGRKGELYYTVDGNHRLAMCIALGIEKIPVKVWRRHTEWQKIRDQILSNSKERPEIIEKKYIQHPDIQSELDSVLT